MTDKDSENIIRTNWTKVKIENCVNKRILTQTDVPICEHTLSNGNFVNSYTLKRIDLQIRANMII